MNKNQKCTTYIGGQAVMEGVMMRGKTSMATAVRDESGEIQVEALRIKSAEQMPAFLRLPFVRGVVNLVSSMTVGTKTLMRSAEVYAGDDEEEPSRFEKWLAKTFKTDIMSVITPISLIIGVLISVGLFVFLPYLFASLIAGATGLEEKGLAFNFIEGGFRILIFIAYLALTALMKDIRRTYMYHGAEHKTITCFEKGMPLTVENIKKCRRVHDRCGTTFLFLVMVISILIFSVANSFIPPVGNDTLTFVLRLAVKLVLLPVVAGVSYELLRLLAKTESPLVVPIKAPGLALQHLTTREPDDDMIECAIAAFRKVQEMDADPAVPERSFAIGGVLGEMRQGVEAFFARADIDGDDAKWIFSLKLGIPMSELKGAEDRKVTVSEAKEIFKVVNERLSGRPLWYIIGDTSFYGYTIKVDERVLIPRPETETLVERALEEIHPADSVLDLCTGSGCIAITVQKKRNCRVTASDLSADALNLAKENAVQNGADITFVQADLFDGLDGRFDCIISNPPYIPTAEIAGLQREVRDFEPHTALDGGTDGLDLYRRIAKACPEHLTEDGKIFLEVGIGEAEAVKKLLEEAGMSAVIEQDLAGIDRIVVGKRS